ncbi:MAG: hypothetical protein IJA55_05615 [Clostridia bacterium]|nr:hypothetical protein [Clostridia bacterium]
MSEKYKVVWSAGKNLYTEGSPIIVGDFSLLRDIQNGGMLCRIRLINITDKTVKRIKVGVVTATESSEAVAEDIYIARDMDVTLDIPLSGFDHNRADFEINEIVYTDSCVQSIPRSTMWEALSLPETLEEYLCDDELVREFKAHFEEGVYFPKEEKDLWFCTCGEPNHRDEAACHSCNRTRASLMKYGVVELKNAVAKQKRIDAVNKDKFEEAYNQVLVDKKSKRNRTFLYILIAAAVITLIALLIAVDGNHYTTTI